MNASAALAHSITWKSSKQSYLTAQLLADRGLKDDCLRAYAYFRWADDQIDLLIPTEAMRTAFIERQKGLIAQLYRGERPRDLSREETMLADLIAHDRRENDGLRSFIHHFMSVIAFDANRKGRIIDRNELAAYIGCLSKAVMDGLQYFIGNDHSYPQGSLRCQAVIGAHITHMLRDMLEDIPNGLINIPGETLVENGICLEENDSRPFRMWVRDQVMLARRCFQEGKAYSDSLDGLRCKLAGVWYCARFERILKAIERDNYHLRRDYPERRAITAWLEAVWLGGVVSLRHVFGRIVRIRGVRTRLPDATPSPAAPAFFFQEPLEAWQIPSRSLEPMDRV